MNRTDVSSSRFYPGIHPDVFPSGSDREVHYWSVQETEVSPSGSNWKVHTGRVQPPGLNRDLVSNELLSTNTGCRPCATSN